MKIVDKNNIRRDIAEAVEGVLSEVSFSDYGTLEILRERLDHTNRFIGMLIEELVKSEGVIRADQLQTLLGYNYSVTKD